MKNLLVVIAVVLTVLSSACTSIQSVPVDRGYLKKGEPVTVYLQDGSVYEVLVGKTTDKTLIASMNSAPYSRVELAYEDIAGIKAERVHLLKTVGAVLGGIIVIPPLIALAVLSEGEWCFGDC